MTFSPNSLKPKVSPPKGRQPAGIFINVLSDEKSAWDSWRTGASYLAHLGLISNQFKVEAEQTVAQFPDNCFSGFTFLICGMGVCVGGWG